MRKRSTILNGCLIPNLGAVLIGWDGRGNRNRRTGIILPRKVPPWWNDAGKGGGIGGERDKKEAVPWKPGTEPSVASETGEDRGEAAAHF